MNIYVYSDESGVFDRVHNDVYVFGGVVFLGKEEKDIGSRKYKTAEDAIRKGGTYQKEDELKATTISNKEKGKLFRSLNNVYKFAVIIDLKAVFGEIFEHKKTKQRYLDYAYKLGIKKAFEKLIDLNRINPEEIERVCFFVDEHSTATDGLYELREALEQEFKIGTFNQNYSRHFPPIFPNLVSVELKFCNSQTVRLVRAADIVANRVYYHATRNLNEELFQIPNLCIHHLPKEVKEVRRLRLAHALKCEEKNLNIL